MIYSDFRQFGNRTVPARSTMINALKPGHHTEFEYLSVEFDMKISDRVFSFQELERGRGR